MKKFFKTSIKLSCMLFILGITVTSVNAYNGKFSFNLTLGWMSPWSYSSYVTKYSRTKNPVVGCTYTSGSTNNFEYTVVNANHQSRVIPFTKAGTFGIRALERNTTVQNYVYALGITRHGGAWNTSANTQGLWNIDSY